MFEDNNEYTRIFNQRAQSYHEAMLRFPAARDEEFLNIADLAQLRAGERACDIPSGGAYLRRFLPEGVELVSVETSAEFADCARRHGEQREIQCAVEALPLRGDSVDKVLSLAGVHHIRDKRPFYREAFRILRPGGVFCLADAEGGSCVDRFLDIFVNAHNSMGHVGYYLGSQTGQELESCGFSVESAAVRSYAWRFADAAAMSTFCQLLFGIDRADAATVEGGIREHLGAREADDGLHMHWELMFFRALKPHAT